ncbi:MAG: carotenoid biosynthesis protein [Leptospirales bacterium]
MHLLLSTLLFRWYVFFFWTVGLVALSRATGPPGALLRFFVAWAITYLFEWNSSRPGGWFPYGHYRYLPTTQGREMWIGHLPLMDSLSLAFLAVGALGVAGLSAGLTLGELLSAPRRLWIRISGIALLLFVMIDMVIDPVALRGGRWFLGQIYDYPQGGAYFGVTWSNFVGWGVTGAVILFFWRILPLSVRHGAGPASPVDRFLPPFLYVSVYLFNLAIALYLGEGRIALADLFLAAGAGTILLWVRRRAKAQ